MGYCACTLCPVISTPSSPSTSPTSLFAFSVSYVGVLCMHPMSCNLQPHLHLLPLYFLSPSPTVGYCACTLCPVISNPSPPSTSPASLFPFSVSYIGALCMHPISCNLHLYLHLLPLYFHSPSPIVEYWAHKHCQIPSAASANTSAVKYQAQYGLSPLDLHIIMLLCTPSTTKDNIRANNKLQSVS